MSWPAVGHESHDWTSNIEVPRRWQSTYRGPCEAAIAPEIARLDPVVSVGTAALADEATSQLTRFDTEVGADIAPFGALLLRTESAASSRIEHLTASARAIALAELGDRSRRNASEIAANTVAMRPAIDLADRLDADAIRSMHATLLEGFEPTMAGRWRDRQVWLGTSSYGPHTADFVPPHHTRIEASIDDLVRFMQRDDLPVLAHAALAHAQFETIHPFVDGNGRTGRALVHSLLRAKGVARRVTIPISAGLLTNTERYVDALTDYRGGDIEPIIQRFAEASYDGVVNGRRLVAELGTIRSRWERDITRRPQAVVWRALDVVLRHPVLDLALIQRELETSAMGADAAVSDLVGIGALVEITGQRRNRRYAAPEILDALDAFAERTGRRSG